VQSRRGEAGWRPFGLEFGDVCWSLLNGYPVEADQCPDDLQVILLLKAFPGYTRQTLLQESAFFIERLRVYLHAAYLHGKEPQGPG